MKEVQQAEQENNLKEFQLLCKKLFKTKEPIKHHKFYFVFNKIYHIFRKCRSPKENQAQIECFPQVQLILRDCSSNPKKLKPSFLLIFCALEQEAHFTKCTQ